MNCLIIEDEARAAQHLAHQLALTGHEVNVVERIGSVKKAISWLSDNEADLIFLDIQLGDGLSFEIFDNVQVKTPVIFTTSYDQYITKAFEVNSISYLLKPINTESLKRALDKYALLYVGLEQEPVNEKIIPLNQEYQKRFLVQSGAAFILIAAEDVAYLRVQNKRYVILVTKQGNQYLADTTLEALEQRLDPAVFFRINRQFTIHIDAIKELYPVDRGRFKIETDPKCKEEMTVSAEKAALFRNWLKR